MANSSSISFVSGDDLEVLQGPKVAVIDVRDEERDLDGHIAGSMHFASESFEEKLPELLQEINGKEAVVFHCAKSQVRGPTCARILCDHLNTAVSEGKMDKVPKVVVLERGFNGWAMAGRPVCSCAGTACNKT
ncbi:hypothetical protein CY35_02G142000 [Sphagnum magellanicum]|nr:hypothetical protein CY35_02G142000 [Sphagnum magellanicum]